MKYHVPVCIACIGKIKIHRSAVYLWVLTGNRERLTAHEMEVGFYRGLNSLLQRQLREAEEL